MLKGRVWVDADTYQVIRVEQRMAGMADLNVSTTLQRKHNLDRNVVVERHDTTIRYKTIPFHDPDEAMILPESIETLYREREPYYRQAHVIIDTTGLGTDQVVARVVTALHDRDTARV